MAQTLILPHRPKGDQLKVYNADTRYFVGAIGRQYGKTTMCKLRLTKRAMPKTGLYFWVSPTIGQAKAVMEQYVQEYHDFLAGPPHLTDRKLMLKSGSQVFFHGADKPDSMRGRYTLDGLIMDECRDMHSRVWPEILRPMTLVKSAWVDFISSTRSNWFKDLYYGAEGKKDWTTHRAPTSASPWVDAAELRKIERETPEMIFRQEYMAEFLDDGSEVFRGIKDCIKGSLLAPVRQRMYLMGVDLAKHVDFTVITVWDTHTKHLVAYDRFNHVDWVTQEQRIMEMSRRYNNAPIVLDATGVGDPVYDRLQSLEASIIPVKFTTATKTAVIRALQLAIEKRDITYPEIPELISELQMFGATVSERGNVAYSAPPGYHDDIVISMALAVSQLSLLPLTGKIELFGDTTMSQYRDI